MTVEAILRCGGVFRTAPLYQYDEGQQIHLTGITLPVSYLAEFANSEMGTAEQVAQTTDTVTIPDKYLTSGNPVYVWIVVVGEDERTTRYEIIVPVRGRGEPDDYTPTPEEQTAIEAAIAALNSAVEAAGVAIEHYPRITDGVWYVWDVSAGEWVNTGVSAVGEDGVSPVVTVESITGGHRVTITDANGDHVFDVLDGEPGNDGTSPTIVVSSITGGHRLTITDAQGTQTVDVLDGTDGNDGRGIVSIVKTGTAGLVDTYTIKYTSGDPTTFTVTNGKDGQPGPGIPAGGTTGQMLVKKSDTDYDGEWANQPSVPVQDVQVNGTSILNNGVANVPLANTSSPGAVIVGNGLFVNPANKLTSDTAGTATVKTGTDNYRPIVPSHQHESTFYGLAKAAGDSTQSASSNAVGTYTEAAKKAICAMIGVQYDAPFRLIKTITISEETAYVYVTTDVNGEAISLDEVTILFEDVVSNGNGSGGISVNGGNSPTGDNRYLAAGSLCSTTAKTLIAHMCRRGGKMFGEITGNTIANAYTPVTMTSSKNATGIMDCDEITEICIGSLNAFKFTSGTITIYGR